MTTSRKRKEGRGKSHPDIGKRINYEENNLGNKLPSNVIKFLVLEVFRTLLGKITSNVI